MADKLDPTRGVWRWAWIRGRQHLDRFLIGGVVLGMTALVIANFQTIPPSASPWERIAYSVGGFILALLIAVAAAFGWALFRAPYEQRDALRVSVSALRDQVEQWEGNEGNRKQLGVLLTRGTELLLYRELPGESSLAPWVVDAETWIEETAIYIDKHVSSADAAIFRDISHGPRKHYSKAVNDEHQNALNAFSRYLANLRSILERLPRATP